MTYRFGSHEIDPARFELRRDGSVVPVEPQVLSLLLYLVSQRDRLVGRDELVDAIWEGRIVSDAAISSRIKSARQAIGDDGSEQRLIRTVHGRGYRFVGAIEQAGAQAAPECALAHVPGESPRPSLAVLPFAMIGGDERYAVIARALPQELISELSRLRWLHITASSSSFRIAASESDIARIGEILKVRYCLSGAVAVEGRRIAVTIELATTADRSVVAAERFVFDAADVHAVREDIVARIVTVLDVHIPAHEAKRAQLGVTGDLDAWSAYHVGLQHMYRFNAVGNAAATAMFEQAVRADPGFARAHAGLSCTNFQNAFMKYAPNVGKAAQLARYHAEAAIDRDPLDPFVNFAMGRCFWLEARLADSAGWLDRATTLSPNYAQGVYATAWTQTLRGNGEEGRRQADRAMSLSPIDPLHYAMLATRALAHVVRGEDDEAVHWAERAAHDPGAHVMITIIAAACNELGGNLSRAKDWAATARRLGPHLRQQDFFRSFPFEDGATRDRLSAGLTRIGL